MSDLKRIAYQVHGTVQGVFFREHARQAARTHGITGWVRNHDSGHVEGEAQGKPADLEKFMGEIEKGSSRSDVDKVVQTEQEEVEDGEKGFEKRH